MCDPRLGMLLLRYLVEEKLSYDEIDLRKVFSPLSNCKLLILTVTCGIFLIFPAYLHVTEPSQTVLVKLYSTEEQSSGGYSLGRLCGLASPAGV